jgi:vitamin B12 transporter
MKKLIFVLINVLFFNQIVLSDNLDTCYWDNKDQISCLEITSYISNTSEHSKSSLQKIVINKKQIIQSGAIDLIDVLNNVSDIHITQSGPRGQQASMFMRGTGSNHTLVMINGVPINDQSTTQGLHDFGVDFIQTIQQIEVYTGSSATHFGTNAVGGAVNIILTGDFKDSVSLEGDKLGNYNFLGNKTFINDNSSLNLKIGTVNEETISARGNINDEKDRVENYTVNINYEKYIKPNLRFYNTTYLRQTVAEYDGSTTNQTGYEGDNKMGTFQFGLENKSQKKKQNSIIYYTIYDREYNERGTVDTYESELLGIKYDFTKTLNNYLSFGMGSEYKYNWGYFNNNGSYSASTKGNINNLAIYSNLGINIFKNTNLSVFLRNDDHKQTGDNSTYKLSLNQKIKKLEFGIARMTGLRNPTLYELYGTDNFGYSGNRNLNAEKSISNELFMKYFINEKLSFESSLYRSYIYNNIEYSNNKYVNDDDEINLNQSGLNGSILYNNKKTRIKFFTSFLSSKKENSADQLRRPEKTYGINLNKKIKISSLGDFNLNTNYKHYGKHFDTHSSSFSTIEMDSTDIVDLSISKNINDYVLSLNIDNFLNEIYQRPHGYPQNDRQIRFGFRKEL